MKQQQVARRLVAVVVTHNRLAQLRQTVVRLLEVPDAQLQAVVVVDNASEDGTADWLAGQNEPRLLTHRARVNGGGAAGFETGMRLAVERFDPDWIVVMDDDARPLPGALAAFHALPEDKWDAVAAAVYFPTGEICEMNRPSLNPFWHWRIFLRTARGGRGGFHILPEAYEGPGMAVDVASFVGLFVSRRAIQRVGYPDGRLFLYGDDGLYTLGLRRAGGRIGFEPSVRFEHDLSTFDGQRGRFRPLWKIYYYHRNLLLLYRLAAGWLFLPTLAVVLPRWLAKRRDHVGQEAVFDRLMRRAIRDGLRGRVEVDHASIEALAESVPETGEGNDR
jgi:GT2 family glycosyltransferase